MKKTILTITLLILNIILFRASFPQNTVSENPFIFSESVFNLQEASPSYVARISPNLDSNGDLQPVSIQQLLEINNLTGVQAMEFLNFATHEVGYFLGNGGYVDFLGVSTPYFHYLMNGPILIKDGRTFTEYEMTTFDPWRVPTLIPCAIAEYENLAVGDILKLRHDQHGNDYDLEIIGIFEIAATFSEDEQAHPLKVDLFSTFILPNLFLEHAMVTPIERLFTSLQDELKPEVFENEIATLHDKSASVLYLLDNNVDLSAFESEANRILGSSHFMQIIYLGE